MALRADDFRSELRNQLRAACLAGKPYVEINAGILHKQLGSYPGPSHRMAMCCEVMKSETRPGDKIVSSPAKGGGASLTIRYQLPREWTQFEETKANSQAESEQVKLQNELASEQYKSLKSEIQELAKSITNLEVLAVGGLVAYYAWMMTHCLPMLPYSIQWLIPILLPILGFFRSRRHLGQIRQIAKYVSRIEDQLALGPENGWEHFIERRRTRWWGSGRFGSWFGFWSFQTSHFFVWALLAVGTCYIAVVGKHLSETCTNFSGI
jgi:5-methylcytosine-specific restriction protein A